jgi:hypothetical protein
MVISQQQTAIVEPRISGATVIQKHWKIFLNARQLEKSVKTYKSLADGTALHYARNRR